MINQEDNDYLLRPFSKDEVFEDIHSCKAPAPEGVHVIFYQKFWPTIGDEVTNHICNILRGIHSPESVNMTNIMIPKVKSPKKMTEFRPIALCNVLLKIATKAIARRMRSILPRVIS